MPRVPRERVERVAMRSEPESVLKEPRKAELNSNRRIRCRRERDKTSSN